MLNVYFLQEFGKSIVVILFHQIDVTWYYDVWTLTDVINCLQIDEGIKYLYLYMETLFLFKTIDSKLRAG